MFTKSDNFKGEYCAQVVKVGPLEAIENSDFLVKAVIGAGYQVVVGKNDVKEGDVMVYAKMETELNQEFLSVNNQFELSERHLNKNYDEVQALIDAGKTDEAKKLVGYFNKHGRVRIVKLRGCPSEGCLFTIDSIKKWKPEVENYDFEQCFKPNKDGVVEPFNFDTIGGDLFCKAYVPKVNEPSSRKDRAEKRNRKIKKFDRMVEGQFSYHYDTSQLTDNMWRVNPDSVVTISVKVHGTSHIVGNLLVKKPKNGVGARIQTKRVERAIRGARKLPTRFYWQRIVRKNKINTLQAVLNNQYTLDYGNVTSSRSVIKNQYINRGPQNHFYGQDIWSEYGNKLFPYLLKGMTVYSEICGYVGKTTSMIQKGYDYGCNPGESFIMPYRITFTDNDGNRTEWEVMEVYGWTKKLIEDHPETAAWLKPIEILYHGTLGDLYPDIKREEHWNTEVLKKLRSDAEHFGMELIEPMCKTKVPREGIVLRIDNDIRAEAFKLKTDAFKFREAGAIDKGEVDVEMMEGYVEA